MEIRGHEILWTADIDIDNIWVFYFSIASLKPTEATLLPFIWLENCDEFRGSLLFISEYLLTIFSGKFYLEKVGKSQNQQNTTHTHKTQQTMQNTNPVNPDP